MKKMKRQVLNAIGTLMLAGLTAFGSQTASVNGVEVTYENASARTLENGDLVLTFTEKGSLVLPKTAKARVVAIGGGGAGGTVGLPLERGAAGGGAGGVSDRSLMMEPGRYTIMVGKGGERAQTCVQSWVGDDGEASAISFEDEKGYLISAKGGGGGGSVKIGGEGTPGASGGGGSWYGDFTRGGEGTEGYGWAGGTPVDENLGGGGGGASTVSLYGVGTANGQGGAGRTNDITGVVVEYARGGRGGNRADSSYSPQDGVTFGSGGDGAVNGLGGRGADGAVIIRISKLFDYKTIQYPTAPVFTNRFIWVNGAQYTALDLDEADEDFRNAIDRIEGTTSISCYIDGAVTNGLGKFDFAIYLNEECKWDDGTDEGNIFPFVGSWRVDTPDVLQNITVEVKKTVDWFEGTNATIAIDVHSTPEKREKIPNVLFIGSLCNAHGYSLDVIHAAINAVTEVGNIDYEFYDTVETSTPTPTYAGSVSKGTTFTKSLSLKEGNHGSMYGLYQSLAKAIDSKKEYDYIIFSFDRTLTATAFNNAHAREQDVVNYLKPFYGRRAVIWLVDNKPVDDTSHGITQTPWFPSPLVAITINNSTTWSSLYYYYYTYIVTSGSGRATTARDRSRRAWRAMMGLFDPAHYQTISDSTYNSNYNFNKDTNSTTLRNYVNNLKGDGIQNQVVYNNATNVAKTIADVVKPTVANLELEDHIYLKNGLKINDEITLGYWTTNESQSADSWAVATNTWTMLRDGELTNSDEEGLRINLTNITTDVWLKLKISVTDTGKFLSSVNATYNERTGQWEKDPNDGPVQVKMKLKDGDEVLAQDQASTTVEWSFEAYRITGGVDYGEGEFIINGFFTNLISVARGYNPEVMFRGAPGWAINYANVDGVVIENVHYMTNWIFTSISADHDIRVGFTNIVVNPPPPEIGPNEVVYDGYGHSPLTTVEPTFAEGYEEYSNMWYMVYSTDPDADPNDRDAWSSEGVITNVVLDADGNLMPQTVYARVCLMQPGYENGCVVDYWIGTNTVTVVPAEVTVTFDDYIRDASHGDKTSGFTYHLSDGVLLAGEELEYNSGAVINRPTQKDGTPGTITSNGKMHVTTPNGGNSNYIVHVVNGTYYYPNTQIVADAENKTKVYDGNSITTEVVVKFPTEAKTTPESYGSWSSWSKGNQWTGYYGKRTRSVTSTTLTVEYSLDGVNYSVEKPIFNDAGEYELFYRVNYSTYSATEQEEKKSRNSDVVTTRTNVQNVNYTTYNGVAVIKVAKRPVSLAAGSSEKIYDGLPLTQSSYAVSDTTDVEGFVNGDGVTSVQMTSASAITLPGSVANTIDSSKITFTIGTNPENYDISYVDGKLTVFVNQISGSAANVTKTYDKRNTNISGVNVTDSNGNPLELGNDYTIAYARNPWDEFVEDLSSLNVTNAGEYAVFYRIDGGDGYGVYEGNAVVTIKPIDVIITAGSGEKDYDGEAFSPEATWDSTVFLEGEGISNVVMTSDSAITMPGTNTTHVGEVIFSEGTEAQNYNIIKVDGQVVVLKGEAEDGGTSWIQDKKVWIVDHEEAEDEGMIYLCFRPNLKFPEELVDWVTRSSKNDKIKVKSGSTMDEMEASTPVVAKLSEKHEILPIKVWVKIPMTSVVRTDAYWKIYIEGSEEKDPSMKKAAKAGPSSDGGPTESENTFGALEVISSQTNTMIAVPWTWYSYEDVEVTPIPVEKLVKPQGLDDGDMVYMYAGKDTYSVWMLEDREWKPMPILKVDGDGTQSLNFLSGDEDARAKRAIGVWVVRKNPVDENGNPKKIYLHGQTSDVVPSITIKGTETDESGKTRPGTTMLGNPWPHSLDINDLPWGTEPSSNDFLTVPINEGGAPFKMTWYNGKWGYSVSTLNSRGRTTISRVVGLEIKPGQAFWYTRNGEPFEITIPNPVK